MLQKIKPKNKRGEQYPQKLQEEILQHVKNYLAKCEESDRQVIAEFSKSTGKDVAKEFEEIKERIENLEIKKTSFYIVTFSLCFH